MKMIMAIVQPARFEIIKSLLERLGIRGLTVTDVRGAGHQKGTEVVYRGQKCAQSLVPRIKLEIAVEDDAVDSVVDTIIAAGRSGRRGRIGDGKVFVLPLEEVARIRTGEAGAAAL